MKIIRVLLSCVVLALVARGVATRAQPVGPPPDSGEVGLGLALRKLGNAGILLETSAHPDDENSGLLAMLGRGQGVRAVQFTATRGTGGQNEIGPELFEALSVLRTEELGDVHRYDGAEQYFGREIDFGYSFSVDESYQKWGREEVLSDYVRMIRTIRPDVVVTMWPEGEQGGAHHQAQARITGEAFRLAADPSKFPEQLEAGLRPWQAAKLYYLAGFGRTMFGPTTGATVLEIDNDVYDALLGRTWAELGTEARSMHKCQGTTQLLPLPGPQVISYRLGDTTLAGGTTRKEGAMFDGIDTSLQSLARFAKGTPPAELVAGLGAIAEHVKEADAAFTSRGAEAATGHIAAGLGAVRALRARLGAVGLDDTARYEIDYRLKTKEEQFENAAVLAQGVRIEVLADDGIVIGGQPIRVQTIVANRSASAMQVKGVTLSGFDGRAACKESGDLKTAVWRCEANVKIPADARLTTPYWRPIPGTARYEFDKDAQFGLPFRPTPFRARIDLVIGGADVAVDAPVQYRYEGNIFAGEKRMELLVVPRFSVTATPDIVIAPSAPAARAGVPARVGSRSAAVPARPSSAPASGTSSDRELRAVVINCGKGPARAVVSLDVPPGWKVTPASAPLAFTREDSSETVRFRVTPPAAAKPGEYTVRAVVRADGASFDNGYEVIEYPHIHRRQRIVPAETSFKLIDVRVVPGLKVGYVMGVGDEVPAAIEQLDARVDLLDADALAWGDLSQYDAIVTGVRAYDRRADLRTSNQRLLDYVTGGGTLVVQYNRSEFNDAQYGPFPAKVTSNRVTDENAPVQVLVPSDSVFTFPNRIGDAAWRNWVQERGLSFLGDKDSRYVDLVQLEDPFPANSGMKQGALVEAKFGKGRWIYVGLALWRQLPAGVDGAYQLLANLISAGRAGPAR